MESTSPVKSTAPPAEPPVNAEKKVTGRKFKGVDGKIRRTTALTASERRTEKEAAKKKKTGNKAKAAASPMKAMTAMKAMKAMKGMKAGKAMKTKKAKDKESGSKEKASCWSKASKQVADKKEKDAKTESQELVVLNSGQTDGTTTTRAQRYMFLKCLGDVDQKDAAEYHRLKDSKEIGKQNKMNVIVNRCIPKNVDYGSKIDPTSSVIFQATKKIATEDAIDTSQGYSETVMIGLLFAGHRELFNEAKLKGEIYQDEDDGLWYNKSKTKRSTSSITEEVEGKKAFRADPKEYGGLLASLMDNMESNPRWLKMGNKALNNKVKDAEPSDQDMLMVQEAFDGVTRVTSAIKKVARELVSAGMTTTSSDLARRGLQLCKNVVESQDAIEAMMFKSQLSSTKVD
jgi:hypothetical protein